MRDTTPTRFAVLRPGLLTTVQDLGRFGYQHFGVPVAGAMDPWALRCANRLVGNQDCEAALEITILGPELRFERRALVALTGGDFSASLDGVTVPFWCAFEIPAGGILTIGERRTGARMYLAIAGGLAIQPTLGSRSTHLRTGMGGFDGRALRRGDTLESGPTTPSAWQRIGHVLPTGLRLAYTRSPILRVVLGPQAEAFRSDTIDVLLRERYAVSQDSDRMGYRLSGTPLPHRGGPDIVSDATPIGSIQVPASQQPILLMADRQTTGGYPKIAVVISSDIPLAAQLMPGDTVGFAAVGVEEARRRLRERVRELDEVLPPVPASPVPDRRDP